MSSFGRATTELPATEGHIKFYKRICKEMQSILERLMCAEFMINQMGMRQGSEIRAANTDVQFVGMNFHSHLFLF